MKKCLFCENDLLKSNAYFICNNEICIMSNIQYSFKQNEHIEVFINKNVFYFPAQDIFDKKAKIAYFRPAQNKFEDIIEIPEITTFKQAVQFFKLGTFKVYLAFQ